MDAKQQRRGHRPRIDGRAPVIKVSVALTRPTHAALGRLGHGNVSAGIRVAVAAAQAAEKAEGKS